MLTYNIMNHITDCIEYVEESNHRDFQNGHSRIKQTMN